MPKLLVETIGPHVLIHPTGAIVHYDRPTVVVDMPDWASFEIARSNLVVLERLPDQANDQEWALWLKESDGDVELARASYVSHLRGDALTS